MSWIPAEYVIKKGRFMLQFLHTLADRRTSEVGIIALAITVCLSTPAQALGETTSSLSAKTTGDCYDIAFWPVSHLPQYLNGSVRTKQQLRNARNLEVQRLRRVCPLLDRSVDGDRRSAETQCLQSLAEKKRKYGARATAHLKQVALICDTFHEISRSGAN